MRRSLLSVVFVPFFLAGCGDDDESLSKEEFIANGDALCRAYEEQSAEFAEPQTVEELVDLLEGAVVITRDFRDDVAALDPPSGDGEEIHETFLTAIDETIEKLDESLAASRDGDVDAAGDRFEEASAAASSVDEELIDYGFDDCADGDGG